MNIIDKLRQITGFVSFSDLQFILYGLCLVLISTTVFLIIYFWIKLKKLRKK